MERACERVKGGRAKSCLACGKAKQRCVGAMWEGGEGLNGTPMGELTGLVRELVGEMKGFQEELREVKEVVEKGLKNMARASHLWHWTPVADALDYAEWWAGFSQEEMEELVTSRFLDYQLEEGERGAGPEERVPEVELEE